MKKQVLISFIVMILALAAAGVWYFARARPLQRAHDPLVYFVDRHIPLAHETQLTKQIVDITAQIGDRVGAKVSVSDLDRWITIGNLSYVLGNLRAARDAFHVAVTVNPVNYVAWGNMGDVLTEMGDLNGARGAYEKAVSIDSRELTYYLKYADFLRTYAPRDTQNYEQLLKAAVVTLGQQPELISRLADFYRAQGQYQEAVTHYEVLVKLRPQDIDAQDHLLEVRAKLLKSAASSPAPMSSPAAKE